MAREDVLLDTHIWIYLATLDPLLREEDLVRINEAEHVVVSAWSGWEVMMLHRKRRIDLGKSPMDVMLNVGVMGIFQILPVTLPVVVRSVADTFPNDDPSDRIIAATALERGLTLVTYDADLQGIAGLKTFGRRGVSGSTRER